MKENEENILDIEEKKRRIRERYRGVDSDELDFIPAKEKENIHKVDVERPGNWLYSNKLLKI